MAEH
jgi:hypothetical protein